MLIDISCSVESENDNGMRAFDLDLELDDGAYKGSIIGTLSKMAQNSAANLSVMEDEVRPDFLSHHMLAHPYPKIAQEAQAIRSSKLKQEFYQALAEDPRDFINKWLESQSKDLDVILGNEHGVREEDLRDTEFFRQPWVDEAVSIHEGLRVAGALQRLHGEAR